MLAWIAVILASAALLVSLSVVAHVGALFDEVYRDRGRDWT